MDHELSRREFLEVSAAAGLATIANTRIGRELTQEQRHTLVAVVRTIFPHERVGVAPYLRAVAAIEERCRSDPTAFHEVTGGIAALDQASGGRFATAFDQTRIDLLKAKRSSPFFRVVYREALESLYGSPEAWALFASARLK